MPRLSWKQAIAWHLRRQHLDRRLPRAKLLSVASELCGLHAQVMSSAELTALCRIDGLRRDDVPKLLWKERKLIKTWAMRSTLHLLPAEDYGRWLHVFADYRRFERSSWLQYFGVTSAELEVIVDAVCQATKTGLLTREQLADEVARITGLPGVREKMMHSWGSLLKPACYRGALCFGPNQGQNARFMHPGIEADPSGAPGFAARKYFAAYGPSTLDEFSRWLQFGRREARAQMTHLGEELAEVDIEGTPAWMLRSQLRSAQRADPVKTVRLLPVFDQYVFAAGLRSAKVLPDPGHHSRVYKTQGWFAPVLLVDGRMDGVWKFARKPKCIELTIEPFVKPTQRVKRAAEEEAERIAEYLGKPLDLRWAA
jgi:hypothetical protein